MRGGSTDKTRGSGLVALTLPTLVCAEQPPGPGRVFPPARLQIRPGETRVVSVLVLGLGRATRPR